MASSSGINGPGDTAASNNEATIVTSSAPTSSVETTGDEYGDTSGGKLSRGEPGSSQVDGGAPQVDGSAPQVDGSAPQVDGSAPQVDGSAPQVDICAPQVDGSAPQVDICAPQVDICAPQVDSGAPQVDGSAPQVDEPQVFHDEPGGGGGPSVATPSGGGPSVATPSGGGGSVATPSGRHLDFNLLIHPTIREPAEPAVGMRRMQASTGPVSSPRWQQQTRSDHQMHQKNTDVLANIMRGTATEVPPVVSTPKPPAPPGGQYAPQLYNEDDFSLHRRNVVHMSHPMNTRLSSNDLKTITQAANQQSKFNQQLDNNNMKSRRHRSSSQSVSPDRRSSSKERKEQKKQRKKKDKSKKKRKTLTSGVHGRTISIPEEHEDEESEEEKKPTREDEEEKVDDVTQVYDNNVNVENEIEPLMTTDDDVKLAKFSIEAESDDDDVISEHAATSDDVMKVEEGEGDGGPCGTCDGLTIEVEDESKDEEIVRKKKHRHHHHHRHHHRKHKHENLLQRRMSGYMKKELDNFHPLQLSDDEDQLAPAQRDEIKSHRYEDRAGIRNHLLHRPVHRKKQRQQIKEQFDRNPHEIYVELDELKDDEWTETARWIKFEEDVEESQMWGKPHAASLSFHSLHDLRRTLQYGSVILDMKATNLEDVARQTVAWITNHQKIDENEQRVIFELIMRKHRHLPTRSSLMSKISQPILSRATRYTQAPTSGGYTTTELNGDDDVITPPVKINQAKPSQINMENLKLMKKIPTNCESAGIFVGTIEELRQPTAVLIRLSEGILIDDIVSLPIPIRFIFLLFGPQQQDFNYHEIGRSMSTLLSDQEFRVMAYRAEGKDEILSAINEFLDDSVVLAPYALENIDMLKHLIEYQKEMARHRNKKKPADQKSLLGLSGDEMSLKDGKIGGGKPPDDDPLKREGKYFAGLFGDIKRRYVNYCNDITDAFNLQCLAAIIFIYFAALSPAITFGGLLGEKTNNLMGASEMLLGCCISGVLYGIFSGQPILIIGSTGPLLVFEEAVYEFCKSSGTDFLAFRVWIGFWISLISVMLVMFEGSFIIRYITKFTEEIFSTLISFIFIFETFNKLAKTYKEHPLLETYPSVPVLLPTMTSPVSNVTTTMMMMNMTSPNMTSPSTSDMIGQPNTALLTTMLMLGTFTIATFLRMFKNSKFFSSNVRRIIGDFGVPIAIFIMVLIDFLIKDTYTQKLNVPKGLSPTDPIARGWFISPINPNVPIYMAFVAIIPAALVFILIFMESQITEMIVSKKERNLKKGTGFHLDIFIIGILNAVMPLFGMPWVCGATLRSITHVNALTIMDNRIAPGESPRVSGVHEQRITTIVVNAMLGVSILMQPLLKEIPLAVLFGIFLYMGVMSLNGVELVERIYMLFMPSKNYPDYSFVKMVQPWKIHVYTIIQIFCLAVLWAVKSTILKISFPFVLVMTVPLRKFIISKFYTKRELQALD